MIKVIDLAQVGEEKINTENEVIFPMVFEIFPQHRLAVPTHPYRSYYTTWIYDNNQPKRQFGSNLDLHQTQFGILKPEPEDKRPQILDFRFGFKEPAELIGDVLIEYDFGTVTIKKITLQVFGKKNKKNIILLGLRLQQITSNIEVIVVSQEPYFENHSYYSA